MSYFRHGDPLDDFDRLDRAEAEHHEQLPVCDDCGHTIDADHYFEIEGDILCEDCMEIRFRRNTEDYINQ